MYEIIAAQQWSCAAGGWARWGAMRAALVPATENMLDLTAIASRRRVLDVGCWSGGA